MSEGVTRKNDVNAKLIRALKDKYQNEYDNLTAMIEILERHKKEKEESSLDEKSEIEELTRIINQALLWKDQNDKRILIYTLLEKKYNYLPKEEVIKLNYKSQTNEELIEELHNLEAVYYAKITIGEENTITAEEICKLIEINKELEKRYIEARKEELLTAASKYDGKTDEEILLTYKELIEKINTLLAKESLSESEEQELYEYVREANIIEEFSLRNTYKSKNKYGNKTLTIDKLREEIDVAYDRKVLVKKLKSRAEYRRTAEDSKRINAESTKRISYLRRTAGKGGKPSDTASGEPKPEPPTEGTPTDDKKADDLKEYLSLISKKHPCTLEDIERLAELRESHNEEIDKIEAARKALEKSLRKAMPEAKEEEIYVFDIDKDAYLYRTGKMDKDGKPTLGPSATRGRGEGFTLGDPGARPARVPPTRGADADAVDAELEVPTESEESKATGDGDKAPKKNTIRARLKRNLAYLFGGILGATGLYFVWALIRSIIKKFKKDKKEDKAKETPREEAKPRTEKMTHSETTDAKSKLKEKTLARINSFGRKRKINANTLEFLLNNESYLEQFANPNQFENVCLAICFGHEMNDLCMREGNFRYTLEEKNLKSFTFDFLCAKAIVNGYNADELATLFGDTTITYDQLMYGFMEFISKMATYGTSALIAPPFEYLFDDEKDLRSINLLFRKLAKVNEARDNGLLTSEETDDFIFTASKMFEEEGSFTTLGAKTLASAFVDSYILIQTFVSEEEPLHTHFGETINICDIYDRIPKVHLAESEPGDLRREQERITEEIAKMRSLIRHDTLEARTSLATKLEAEGIEEKIVNAIKNGTYEDKDLQEVLDKKPELDDAVREFRRKVIVANTTFTSLVKVTSGVDRIIGSDESLSMREAIELRKTIADKTRYEVVDRDKADSPEEGRSYSRGPKK